MRIAESGNRTSCGEVVWWCVVVMGGRVVGCGSGSVEWWREVVRCVGERWWGSGGERL